MLFIASGGRNASIEYIDRRASDADGDQMLICDTSLFGGSAGAVNSIGVTILAVLGLREIALTASHSKDYF